VSSPNPDFKSAFAAATKERAEAFLTLAPPLMERIKAMGIEKTGKTVKRIADQLSTELGHSTDPQYGKPVGKRLRLVK
jgi:hypothetical protein